MKSYKRFIIGTLTIAALILPNHDAQAADICNPNNIKTQYKSIYCGIRMEDNEAADEEIVEILSTQFDMKEDLITEILDNTICKTVLQEGKVDLDELPESVQNTCLPSGKSIEQAAGGWSVFTDIRNAYNKENKIRQSKISLEFKFKISERYWDGKVGSGPFDLITDLVDPFPDAPFDLIVDLNLIEIVLFGSKATWLDDVYSFPTEEDDEENGEVPLDELLPKEEKDKAEKDGIEDTGDPGVSVIEEEGEEVPPDCVLPDDPEADLGGGPSSSYENPLCGNNTVDILVGEQCDDGNKQSGDGCNQYCQTEASGSNDQCMDPEAVTFKKPEDKISTDADADTDAEDDSDSKCPEGMFPKSGAGFEGQEAGPPQEVPQNPEYPGPFLGGTLKQFADSAKPPCPGGYFDARETDGGASATAKGEETLGINVAGNQYDIPRCLPTEFCADFKAAQDFLFGEGWEDDEVVANIAPAIEALFCVNIVKENRPQSTYLKDDGCIDCHISAMVDSLERALATNVTPLKNTTAAFTTSSPYGTNFSFNLMTAAKAKLKYKYTGTSANSLQSANERAAESKRKHTPVPTSLKDIKGTSPLKTLAETANQATASKEAMLEDVRITQMSNKVISDQEVGGRINPLLGQMRDSFMRIQSQFEIMIGTKLNEKPKCQ